MRATDSQFAKTLKLNLNEQMVIISLLLSVDENELETEQLLGQAFDIITSNWPTCTELDVSFQYGDIQIRSDGFTDSNCFTAQSKPIRNRDRLITSLSCLDESAALEDSQAFIDSITQILASKIERIHSKTELNEKQKFLDKAYKLARIGTWEYDMINDRLYWSDITKEVHGFGPDHEPTIENTLILFKEGFHRDTFAKTVDEAINHGKAFDVELKIISGQGDERWIRATGEPEFEDGICVRFYGISQNVTNRKQAKEDLQLSERRFRALVQDGSDMIAILDGEANYKYVSPTSLKVLGYHPESMLSMNALELVHPDDRERALNHLKNLKFKEQVLIEPFRFADVNGNWRWLETTLTNLTQDPAIRGYVANSRDITEQYLRQIQIEGSLKKKEILLSEIHHRIKNNLSALTGLLQLQSLRENNEEVVERLSVSVTRIHAMASMHEQLYQSKNFSKLELSDRIKLLVLNIQNTLQLDTKIDIRFECESIKLHVNKALPFSLILNEVITNIFKHAFKGRDKGVITIYLNRTVDQQVQLRVTDDGIGIPPELQDVMGESDTLGMTLIDELSAQLDAKYQFDSTPGETTFTLTFK